MIFVSEIEKEITVKLKWELDEAKWPGDTFKQYTTAMKEELGVKGTTLWFELERFTGPVSNYISRCPDYNPDWLIPT